MRTLKVSVDPGKEIYEIASDFANPIEVLRESLHNSYDAGAKNVSIYAKAQQLKDGRRVLTLEFNDDGIGMSMEMLEKFFSLGFTEKPELPGRPSIGFKGHGTKIYYQSQAIWIATRQANGEFIVAHVEDARESVFSQKLPVPRVWKLDEAKRVAIEQKLSEPKHQGTFIRLIDFTPDSSRVIDEFQQKPIENYLRWFTVFGSFEHIVHNEKAASPICLMLQGTDLDSPSVVEFGHKWPADDRTTLKSLKQKDERRPFNFFCKTLRREGLAIEGGYKIDIAACFEGSTGRSDRDLGLRRQNRKGLYTAEERYGMWLCKNFIPVEKRFEWLSETESPFEFLAAKQLLLFINCEDFKLTANRGSVGNSAPELLQAVKKATLDFLEEAREDKDLISFTTEFQEDQFSRLREKDKKALQRRVERYNKKDRCHIKLPNGKEHFFFEPTREITLFGLISELQLLDPSLLGMKVLDYDDHVGIDLLVKRNGNAGNMIARDREKVAYTELKYLLRSPVNHTFDSLYSVICWDSDLEEGDAVLDSTGRIFSYNSNFKDGVTYSNLTPPPDSDLSSVIKIVNLRRLLNERCGLQREPNPEQLPQSSATTAKTPPRGKRR